MPPITIQSNPVNQRVALATAMKALQQAMTLSQVRNGTTWPSRAAGCATSRSPGVHQQQAHGVALTAAISVLQEHHDQSAPGDATQKALAGTLARLTDSTQAPFGSRVVNQLTVLGALHAALRELPQSDAVAQALQPLQQAIAAIGARAGACSGNVDGFDHGDRSSAMLVAALQQGQQAAAACRSALGDQAVFEGLAAGVLTPAMKDSISQRLPHLADALQQGLPAIDILELLQRQYAVGTENAMTHLLQSGAPEDFSAAVFAFLKLPEYVLQACDDATPPGPPAKEDEQVPDAGEGPALFALPDAIPGGNQAVNVSPATALNINNFEGLEGVLRNLGNRADHSFEQGRALGRMEGENAVLHRDIEDLRRENDRLRHLLITAAPLKEPAQERVPHVVIREQFRFPPGPLPKADPSPKVDPLAKQRPPVPPKPKRNLQFAPPVHHIPLPPPPRDVPAGDGDAVMAELGDYFSQLNDRAAGLGRRQAVRAASGDGNFMLSDQHGNASDGTRVQPAAADQVLVGDVLRFQQQRDATAAHGYPTPPGEGVAQPRAPRDGYLAPDDPDRGEWGRFVDHLQAQGQVPGASSIDPDHGVVGPANVNAPALHRFSAGHASPQMHDGPPLTAPALVMQQQARWQEMGGDSALDDAFLDDPWQPPRVEFKGGHEPDTADGGRHVERASLHTLDMDDDVGPPGGHTPRQAKRVRFADEVSAVFDTSPSPEEAVRRQQVPRRDARLVGGAFRETLTAFAQQHVQKQGERQLQADPVAVTSTGRRAPSYGSVENLRTFAFGSPEPVSDDAAAQRDGFDSRDFVSRPVDV